MLADASPSRERLQVNRSKRGIYDGTSLDFARNIIAVTAGNAVGGAIAAAGLLWLGHGYATEHKPPLR